MTLPPALLDALAGLAGELSKSGAIALAGALETSQAAVHASELRQRTLLPLGLEPAIEAVLRAWRVHDSDASGAVLATALRAMCAYDDHLRRELRVEAVWTGPREWSSGLRRTEQVILEMIAEARQSVWLIAFAAYRVPAIARALRDAGTRGVTVRLVVEDREISQGKVSFDPLPALVEAGLLSVEVYVWPLEQRPIDERGRHGTLHAKGLVVDECMAFITSANLTEDALNLNMELGVALRVPEAARQIAAELRGMVLRGVLVHRVP